MKKHTIWLNLITICLCISAIAIGVYSAKIAKLNVGGTIGFNAHNCDVLIWGDIEGAVTDPESTTAPSKITTLYSSTDTEVNETTPLQISGDSTEKLQMPSSGIFFYDYGGATAPDIVLTIHCQNNSAFAIKVDCDLDALTKSLEGASNITYSSNIPSKIGKGESADIVITFHLTSKTQDASCNFDLPMSFSMAADLTQFVKHDDTNDYYYIEMGESASGATLKWFPIAKQNTDGTFEKFDYTTQPVLGETYYFMALTDISKATGEEYIMFSNSDTSYYAQYYNTTSSSWVNCTDSSGNKIYGSDYSVSNIRNYLNNKTALVGSELKGSSIETTLQLTYDTVYNSITPRSIQDMYSTDTLAIDFDSSTGYSVGSPYTASAPTFTSVNMGTYTNDGADKLWLLSYYEIHTYIGQNSSGSYLRVDDTSCGVLRTASKIKYLYRTSVSKTIGLVYCNNTSAYQTLYYPAFQVTI